MDELSRQGYPHVALNHLPTLGMPFGRFGFVVALLPRSRAARVTALAVLALAGASARSESDMLRRPEALYVVLNPLSKRRKWPDPFSFPYWL